MRSRTSAAQAAAAIVGLVAAVEVEQVGAGALFADQGVEFRQEHAVLVVPDHHVAVGADQQGAERVVGVPQLHVGAVGGVADVERVGHDQAAVAAGVDGVDQPLPAVLPHRGQVGQRQPRCFPLVVRQFGGPDLDPVGIVRGAVAQHRALAGVDLAGIAVVLVHPGFPFRSPGWYGYVTPSQA